MTIEQKIQEYVDGSLSLKDTEELFAVLAQSPELRTILDEELWLLRSLTNTVPATLPSPQLETRILASISQASTRTSHHLLVVGFSVLVFGVTTFLALVTETKTPLHGIATVETTSWDTLQTDENIPMHSNEKQIDQNINTYSEDDSVQQGLDEVQLPPLESLSQSYDPVQLLLPTKPLLTQGDFVFADDNELMQLESLLTIENSDSKDLGDLPLELSARLVAQQLNLPRQSTLLPSPGTSYALRLSLSTSQTIQLGLEVGREQFLQNYSSLIQGTRTFVNVSQLGDVWWAGGNLQFIPFRAIGPFQPSLGGTVGWSNVGPIARIHAGINIPHGAVTYSTGLEYSVSTYRDGATIKNPSNISLTIGIGFKP